MMFVIDLILIRVIATDKFVIDLSSFRSITFSENVTHFYFKAITILNFIKMTNEQFWTMMGLFIFETSGRLLLQNRELS